MDNKETEVIPVALYEVPKMKEYWLPLYRYDSGPWYAGILSGTMLGAEEYFQNYARNIHERKIARIILPL